MVNTLVNKHFGKQTIRKQTPPPGFVNKHTRKQTLRKQTVRKQTLW